MSEKPACKNVLEAMIAIQAEVQNPLKLAKTNNYTYVELDALLDVVRPIATRHGIAIVQHVEADQLVTELWHVSGDSKMFRMPLRPSGLRGGSEAQQMGAAVTYARKYSLMGLFAIHGDKDDDAAPEKAKTKAEQAIAQAERATPAGHGNLADLADKMAESTQRNDLAFTSDPLYDEWVYETAKRAGQTQESVRYWALQKVDLARQNFMEWKGAPCV